MTNPSPAPAANAPAAAHLAIDVWSDIGCPWCYVGKSRLDQAIASSPHPGSISVTTHSFELDPAMSGNPKSTLDVVAQKMGVSVTEAEALEQRMAALAGAEGLEYSARRVHANSFDTHRVLHLAADHGVAGQVLSVIQRELFSGRANVYDRTFLAATASDLGIPRERAEEVLSSDEYADAVRQDEAEAQQLGVTGVPFAVFGGRLAIPGAASVDGYVSAIEQARSQR
jgi:predicted DsbA family dithiol-disulfide isomerase